ncbi:MAG: hypothetical protein L0Y73_02695, partial [Candidatus Aminicenantes bacterium]|nr:hypothetical protein [Candidatus Aminicenantes bacterium]
MKKAPIFFGLLLTIVAAIYPGVAGKFEVGFHYSFWSIDIIAPLVEDLTPELKYYDPEKGKINFDSYGNNYGFEFRYFPYGHQGSFSVGLSYERNNFEANAKGAYTDYPG